MNRKVYVVEVGAYEQRGIMHIFTTREAAEHWVIEYARLHWESLNGWSVGRSGAFPDPTGLTFDQWRELADDSWNWTGAVEEHALFGDLETETDLARMASDRAQVASR